MRGGIEYNRDLFRPNRIARLAGHFERILDQTKSFGKRRCSARASWFKS
jgi:hypothetical protein